MARKTKEEAQATRQRILDVALDLFAEKGYWRTTFVDIAENIGLTKGAVYWHFPDKPQLLAAMIQEMRKFESYLIARDIPEINTLDDLKTYFIARTRIVVENEKYRKFAFFIFLQMEWSAEMISIIRGEMQKVRIEPFEEIDQFLLEAQERGELKPGTDLRKTKEILVGFWVGLVTTHLQDITECDPVAIAEFTYNLFIEQFRATAPQSEPGIA